MIGVYKQLGLSSLLTNQIFNRYRFQAFPKS